MRQNKKSSSQAGAIMLELPIPENRYGDVRRVRAMVAGQPDAAVLLEALGLNP